MGERQDYIQKIFYDVFICWYLNNFLMSHNNLKQIERTQIEIEFVNIENNYFFKVGNNQFDLGDFNLFKDFRDHFFNKMINYGFSISKNYYECDNNFLNEQIIISGTNVEFYIMRDCEIFKNNSKKFKTRKKTK